eukprot:COSAG02_NODE_29562_length_567_cov_0.583333_1_plen_66_part_01
MDHDAAVTAALPAAAEAEVRQRSSLLKAVITAFPSVSLPFLAVPLRSRGKGALSGHRQLPGLPDKG